MVSTVASSTSPSPSQRRHQMCAPFALPIPHTVTWVVLICKHKRERTARLRSCLHMSVTLCGTPRTAQPTSKTHRFCTRTRDGYASAKRKSAGSTGLNYIVAVVTCRQQCLFPFQLSILYTRDQTRTRGAGTGFLRLQVWVRPWIPAGLPVQFPSGHM